MLLHLYRRKLYVYPLGGGPLRPHSNLTNINISDFQNVDIVADAHMLPYSDNSVDAIYCEAVLEHLNKPNLAVKEMNRVLRTGGKVIAITPFLQAYHGYPNHYQNFTISGHKNLFEVNNFHIDDYGVCVGPMYTFVNLVSVFIREYTPLILAIPLRIVWHLIGSLFLKPFDIILNKKENAYIFASTTYVVAVKNDIRV